MSDALVGIFFGLGAGMWLYAKVMHSSGNQQSALITGGSVALGGFLLVFTLFKFVFGF
jgi:hypothetical protein